MLFNLLETGTLEEPLRDWDIGPLAKTVENDSRSINKTEKTAPITL